METLGEVLEEMLVVEVLVGASTLEIKLLHLLEVKVIELVSFPPSDIDYLKLRYG